MCWNINRTSTVVSLIVSVNLGHQPLHHHLQLLRSSFYDSIRSMDMDILLLQFCAVARENMESAVFMRMAERFEVIRTL